MGEGGGGRNTLSYVKQNLISVLTKEGQWILRES